MKKKILLVDDEETLRWALDEALSAEGYEIKDTNDSIEALEFSKKTQYDLVISDLTMPTMNGLQLISEIRKIHPNTKALIITGYGSTEAVIEALHTGVQDFITKPFKIDHIKSVVSRLLNEPHPSSGSDSEATCETNKKTEEKREEYLTQNKLCFVTRAAPETENRIFYDFIETEKYKAVLLGGVEELDTANFDDLKIIVKTLFRCLVKKNVSSSLLLKEINHYLCEYMSKRFPVSVCCAVIDKQQNTLCYSVCGEVFTLFFKQFNRDIEIARSYSFSLNLFPGIKIMENTVIFPPGSKLFSICNRFLSEKLRNENLAPDIFKEVLSDEGVSSCEDNATNIKIQIEKLGKDIAEAQKCIVMVLKYDVENSLPWEEEFTISTPVQNFEKLINEFDSKLSVPVNDALKRHEIITAVNEAILNAVTFAYNKNEKGEIVIRFLRVGEEIITEISDHGCGFDMQKYKELDMSSYDDLLKREGRGIFIMKRLMDRVMIQSHESTGTSVFMAKRINCGGN